MRVYHFLATKYALKTLYEHRIKISTITDLNDPFEMLCFDTEDPVNHQIIAKTIDEFSRSYGVVCFSKSWKNPLLWAHYIDKHKGICLGFDLPDDYLKEVTYLRDRIPFPEGISDINEAFPYAEQFLYTKFEGWRYEDEVRIFVNLNDNQSELGLYFYDFDEHIQLREVIIGVRCPVTRSVIERAVRDYPIPIRIIKATLSRKNFEVIEDLRGLEP
jgi:hypothetical protein